MDPRLKLAMVMMLQTIQAMQLKHNVTYDTRYVGYERLCKKHDFEQLYTSAN